jgi:hypothetical protein
VSRIAKYALLSVGATGSYYRKGKDLGHLYKLQFCAPLIFGMEANKGIATAIV